MPHPRCLWTAVRAATIAGLFVLAPTAAMAESLTLEAAIEIAARQNPHVLRGRETVEAASGRKLQAESFADPRLIYEFEEAKDFSPGNFGNQKIGVSQSFELFGKRGLRGKTAEAQVEAARQELRRAIMVTASGVKRAYWNLVAEAKVISDLESTRELLKSFLESTRVRFEGGTSSYADVARAKVEISKIENDLSGAGARLETAQSRLNVILGRAGDTPVEPVTRLRFTPESRTLEEIRSDALASRPRILAAEAEQRRRETERRLARRSYLPDLELTGSYDRFESGGLSGSKVENGWAGEIALTFPFPGAKRQRGLVREAEARRRVAAISMAAAKRMVSAAIDRAYAQLLAAEEQAERYRSSLLPDAEDALRSGTESYQYGQIDFLDLLDIYRTYKEIQIAYTRSLESVLVAQANLEVAGEDEEDVP